jgi:tryptophan synthase alpha chain
MARAEPKTSLGEAFARGRVEGRALLMPFLVCGYPDPETFVGLAQACAEAGADVLEIGMPFSDPIMDGPVIASAAHEVLESGLRVRDALGLIGRVSEAARVPLVAMTYYNLIFRAGPETFARALVEAGSAAAIVPDLSVEDSEPWRRASRDAGLAPVFIAALTSPPERLRMIGAASEGFVYAASLLGVTGVRETLNARARSLVEQIRAAGDLPVAVGIGVSTPEHAREAAAYADGVIVGSALVKRIGEARAPIEHVRAFVTDLRAACAREGA